MNMICYIMFNKILIFNEKLVLNSKIWKVKISIEY